MGKKKRPQRTKPPEKGRIRKPKVSPLVKEKIEYIDYKDVNLLRAFMSERAKIRARRVNGNGAQQQREVARAIKNAREMALLPYSNRVVTQRRGDKRRPPRPEGQDMPAAPPSGDGPRVGDTAPAPQPAVAGGEE
jgi:small subunit ribosomal protein S18